MKRLLRPFGKAGVCFVFAAYLAPATLSADATVQQQGVSSGVLPKTNWTRTLRIKGTKMRVDSVRGSDTFIYVYDLEAGKRYRLDEKKHQVFVQDLAEESERLKTSLMFQNLKKVIKPTGRQLQIAGTACDEYTFDLQAPTHPSRGFSFVLHDHGTVCASQITPVGKDLINFVHEAMRRGYLVAASVCSPFASQIGPYFYGDQTNVLLLSANSESEYEGGIALDVGGMGPSQSRMTVTTINPDPVPDEIFQIPSDWKRKTESTPH